ncbi:cohesin subunit SA-2-like [Diretmus argenteus]
MELQCAKEDGYLPGLTYLDTARGISPIIEKLPYGLQEKWISHGSRFKEENGGCFPPFRFFANFIGYEALEDPGKDSPMKRNDGPGRNCPIHNNKPHPLRKYHRNYLRFLWYRDNDMSKDVINYRMKVHVFGNSPSPAVAIYGLRRAVQEGAREHGADTVQFVERHFYVDDGLLSLPTEAEAIDLLQRTQASLSESNLRLHKFVSNRQAVMDAFPPEDRALGVKDMDLTGETPTMQRSLGLCWEIASDTFTFAVSASNKPFTRRGVLSTVNSLFDPLGLVAPVTIQGRALLRELTVDMSDWDIPLPEEKLHNFEVMNGTSPGSDFDFQPNSIKQRNRPVPGPQQPKRTRHKAAAKQTSSPGCIPIPTPRGHSLQPQQTPAGTSRQASTRPVRRGEAGNQGMSAGDMFDAVCSGKSAMVMVVDEWLDSYKQSREAGLLELINFIVQCCGCKGVVTRDMFDNMQNAEIISSLTKEFREGSENYPLCTPGPQWKRFKAGLCEFVRVLVRSCQNSLLYDQYLFSSLMDLLTGMSDSQVRAFRHTSTLLAMKLMTGVMEVAVKVSTQLQISQRRYDLKKRKNAQDRAPARLGELQENREVLSSLMHSTFRGVFVHRYRDHMPEVRAVCIEELGKWLSGDPEDFLNHGHLKYLGWTLSDKQSPVRLQCVLALQMLYQEKDFIGFLELFTSRFKERMLCMVRDKDPDVAVEIVHLLLLIHQKTEGGLQDSECGRIYPLVFASHRGLASAAGNFLYNNIKKVIASDYQERWTTVGPNVAFFNILVSFYIQNEFQQHGVYLVDSLWDVAGSELRDWETMTTLLLQDDGLSDKDEGALIELMMCAIKRAAEGFPPVGRTQGKKILNMKDKKIQAQDRRRITTHFINLMPQLLAKYSVDEEKVCLLLEAPFHFDLEMYSSSKPLEKHLDLLVSQVCGIVKKHSEARVLEACARLVPALCSDCYTFSTRTHRAFSQLLDGLTECFNTYLDDLLQGTADEEDMYKASLALKRVATFNRAMDLKRWKLFNPCLDVLQSNVVRDLDNEFMVSALKCAAFHLLWAKVSVVRSMPNEVELLQLKKEVCLFYSVGQTCLSLDQAEIRDQAFEVLCDVVLLYSPGSVRSQPALQTLAQPPPDSLRSEMASFVMDYIFTGCEDDHFTGVNEEMTIAIFQRKRKQLISYCKLFLYGALDLSAATDVFKHYSKYHKEFGDIMKETLSKSRLINPVQSAKTVCLSLQQLFSEMISEKPDEQELGEIRGLAKRLAMSFGNNLHRVRKSLVALHMDGMRFAFRDPKEGELQHPNLAFLEILSDFTFKVLLQDRAQLSAFLKAQCPSAALSWPSVRMYQRSLEGSSSKRRQEKGGGEKESSILSPPITPAPKRRKTTAQDSVSSAYRLSWMDSSSIDGSLLSPAFTSTVLLKQTKPQASTHSRDTEDEFDEGSLKRKVRPRTREQPSSRIRRSPGQLELKSSLGL